MKEEEMKIKAGKPYETEIRKTPEACHRTGGRG